MQRAWSQGWLPPAWLPCKPSPPFWLSTKRPATSQLSRLKTILHLLVPLPFEVKIWSFVRRVEFRSVSDDWPVPGCGGTPIHSLYGYVYILGEFFFRTGCQFVPGGTYPTNKYPSAPPPPTGLPVYVDKVIPTTCSSKLAFVPFSH